MQENLDKISSLLHRVEELRQRITYHKVVQEQSNQRIDERIHRPVCDRVNDKNRSERKPKTPSETFWLGHDLVIAGFSDLLK